MLFRSDGDAFEAPRSVVVKLPSAEPGNRQIGIAMGLYENEVRFYREIAPQAGITVPRLHWGDVEPPTGRITLVIDDLTTCAEVGDMIAMATPEMKIATPPTAATSKAAAAGSPRCSGASECPRCLGATVRGFAFVTFG